LRSRINISLACRCAHSNSRQDDDETEIEFEESEELVIEVEEAPPKKQVPLIEVSEGESISVEFEEDIEELPEEIMEGMHMCVYILPIQRLNLVCARRFDVEKQRKALDPKLCYKM
jgi:hypothetical protein